eukprot:g5192.t1
MSSVPTTTLYSAAGVEIVTQPFLVGAELERLALECSKDFARALPADLPRDAVSLEILNGGHYYFVGEAVEAALGRPCRVSTIRAKRRQEESGDWRVNVWDAGGADVNDCSALLIGDTIATGTTLVGVLEHLLEQRRERGLKLPDIYIFAIAGSSLVSSAPGIGRIDAALRAQGRCLHLYFANAQFNLASNGTDLGFEGALYEARAEREIRAKLGGFAPHMRCCVWDWGDRFRMIADHLEEIQHYYAAQPGCPDWLLDGIAARADALGRGAVAAPAARFALAVALVTVWAKQVSG